MAPERMVQPLQQEGRMQDLEQEWDCLYPRSENTLATYLQQKRTLATITTTLPKPWIHIGMPKTGTTTLEHFWKCGLNQEPPSPRRNHDQVSHSTCQVSSKRLRDVAFDGEGIPVDPLSPCPPNKIRPCQLCGSCMKQAKNMSLPLLSSCGNYTAWAQLDTEEACYFPQLSALSEIHQEAPTATLVFMFRSMDEWIHSVKNYKQGFMLRRFRRCQLPYWQGRRQLKEWYCQVVHHARQFAATHPTHTYIEIDLEDPQTSQWASQAFGIQESCWGRHNVNTRIHHGNVTTQ